MKPYSFSLLCLASFTKLNVSQIHPYCHMYTQLILLYFMFYVNLYIYYLYYVLFLFHCKKNTTICLLLLILYYQL